MTSTLYSILARIALTLALIALALALGLTVVTAQDVGYNAMPGADFNKYKTYKWVAQEPTRFGFRTVREKPDAVDEHGWPGHRHAALVA